MQKCDAAFGDGRKRERKTSKEKDKRSLYAVG